MEDKLYITAEKLSEFYVIDKIKPFAVYVYDKESEDIGCEGNIFDIYKNELVFYGNFKKSNINPNALPIIEEIQKLLE